MQHFCASFWTIEIILHSIRIDVLLVQCEKKESQTNNNNGTRCMVEQRELVPFKREKKR